MFDADRAITTSDQDRLNRALFAKYLARCMLDHPDKESVVIGLYGSSGVGKTSIINMVIEELNYAANNMLDGEKPIILNFSPWSYSGQHQLIYNFFRRLSSTIRQVNFIENAPRIIHLLELYVSYFTQKPIPQALRTKRSWLEKLTFRHQEEVFAWESGRDLTLIKAELNELLRNQNHKIIILIDNISLLYDYEIKEIFQIVKSIGDYANTTYLLSFDQEQVIRAINKIDGGGGKEFLEKIVQLPFEVPPILEENLERILADRLNAMIATVPPQTWNTEHWADIYYSSLKYFFKNCRDIARYINTLNFSYLRFRDIVNPVDFFALTAIEVFIPNLYFGIRDNKDLFTDLLDNVYIFNQEQLQKDRLRCDEILARCNTISREILIELLIRLFPRLRNIYQPGLAFFHSIVIARKLKRICSPDLFDGYFRLSMQQADIPASEFETILTLAANINSFDQALARLNQDDRIIKFLDHLDSKVLQRIPKENIPAIISALLDNGDLFPPGIAGPLNLDTPMRIYHIVHELLRRYHKAEERFSILQTAIANATKSLHILVHELKEQQREHLEEEDTFLPLEFRDLTPDQLDSLRKLTVSRIKWWAKTERLIDHPKLLPILYAWRDWGDEDDCKQFVIEATKTDKGLIAFLIATLNKAVTQAMVEYEKDPIWINYIDDIEAFVPAQSLLQHAKELFEDGYFEKLREKEQLALMIFLDLMQAPTEKNIPKTTV